MKRALWYGVLVALVIGIFSVATAQVSPWPMFRHDLKNTGRTNYSGPGTPTLQWTYPTNEGVASSPSIGPDGTIYVGAGWFWQYNTDSALYALNPDGTLKWKFYTRRGVFSSPTIVEDGTIYFGSLDRYLYAIEDSSTYAKLKWKIDLGHWNFGSPAVADDGTIYLGTLNWLFYAVDPAGTVKWTDQAEWCVFSSPAIRDDGTIVVGSKDHYLYAYEDLDTGFIRLWRHPVGTWYDGHLIDASPAIADDGTIYVGTDQYGAAGQTPIPVDTSFFAINPDGSRKWSFPTDDGVESSPAIGHDGTIYFGSYDSCVYAVRDRYYFGELLWKYKTGGPVDASPTVGGDGTIYIGSRDSVMYAFNPDGSILWTFKADGDIESSVTIAGDGRIYFGGMEGKIYALGDIGPDVGPFSMNIPSAIPADTTVNPEFEVRNYRTTPATLDAVILIEDGVDYVYGDTITGIDLSGGDNYQGTFEPWVIGSVSDQPYTVTLYTIFAGDDNSTNDTLSAEVLAGISYICGELNGSPGINLLDITYLMNYVYKGGPEPSPLTAANVNGDGAVNILDIVYFINFLYKAGPEPVCAPI